MQLTYIRILVVATVATYQAHAPAADWLQYGGNAQRDSMATNAPLALSANLWTTATNQAGEPIVFEGASSPIIFGGRVYASARVLSGTTHVGNKLVAIDAADGTVLFETPILKGTLNSWSSSGIDALHGTVLIGSGNTLHSIDAAGGAVVWSTPLVRNIVNASVAVAVDLVPGRAFITDYDGNGNAGALYCLNTSAYDAQANPFQPGEIVWQETIGGTSGNSPAYANGVVYVASVTNTASPGFPDVGHVHAFDVDAPDGARLLWSVGAGEGFFGGVTVRDGFVYAASYDLFGGQDNSNLVKIRASDGMVQWTIACERTNSIPIVTGDRIYLAAGIPGFGSAPKVEAFVDHATFATKLWDTYSDSGGTLLVGGWTHQPVMANGVLYCGRIPSGSVFFGAYTEIFMLDLARMPGEPDFVIDHRIGYGSSPAISDGRLYSIGPDGLHAAAEVGDVCGAQAGTADGLVNGSDVQCFVNLVLAPEPSDPQIAICDFDGDAMLTPADAELFVARLLNE